MLVVTVLLPCDTGRLRNRGCGHGVFLHLQGVRGRCPHPPRTNLWWLLSYLLV